MARIDQFFVRMVQLGASDLHMSSEKVPMFRLHGDMVPVAGCDAIPEAGLRELLWEITPERNRKEFDSDCDTDFAYEIPGQARFRCNYFMDRTGMGAVFRLIPEEVLTVDQLGLPKVVRDLCYLSKGLVLVTGPTGSGKSTTLAAMIDLINKTRSDHIITIEDPVEFVHKQHRCLVNQREVGRHTQSFKRALRAALREDPDIVLVGEMRDLETIEIAIETAETGHLVFGTLHTTTAPSTVDRIIDQFPADRQDQIRTMLSSSLKGVVSQTLCKKQPKGRVAALEILLVTSAVSAQIREGKTYQIQNAMQTGGRHGMRLLNDSLAEFVSQGLVDPGEAYIKAIDKLGIQQKFEQMGVRFDTASLGTAEQPAMSPAPAAAAPAQHPNPPAPLPGAPPAATRSTMHDAPGSSTPPPPAAPTRQPAEADPFEAFKHRRGR